MVSSNSEWKQGYVTFDDRTNSPEPDPASISNTPGRDHGAGLTDPSGMWRRPHTLRVVDSVNGAADTSREASGESTPVWRSRTALERWALLVSLDADVEAVARARIVWANLDFTEADVDRELFRRRYGSRLTLDVYGSSRSHRSTVCCRCVEIEMPCAMRSSSYVATQVLRGRPGLGTMASAQLPGALQGGFHSGPNDLPNTRGGKHLNGCFGRSTSRSDLPTQLG
jgi:hypothetical protein